MIDIVVQHGAKSDSVLDIFLLLNFSFSTEPTGLGANGKPSSHAAFARSLKVPPKFI